MAAGDCAFHALLIVQHVKETAVPIPVAQERPPPRNEHFETWLPEEQQVLLLREPARIRFMKLGNSQAAAWWVVSRKGGMLGKCWTRRQPAVSAEAAMQPRHLTIVKLLM